MSIIESRNFPQAFHFPPFSLDLTKHLLEKDEEAVFLTPRAFALLRYLIERANRLVTKQELLDVVWEEAIVGDAVIRVCMNEVRKALGDNPESPRFIETVHRKGYRFIAPVCTTPPVVSDPLSAVSRKDGERNWKQEIGFSAQAASLQSLASPVVGREAELRQLYSLFDKAANGECQIVFLSGEAGIGKTALVEAFLSGVRSLESSRPSSGAIITDSFEGNQKSKIKNQKSKILSPQFRTPHSALCTLNSWVLCGQCLEHFGVGEAYMPLLDAFTQLVRMAPNTKIVELLRRYAPMWLLEMPGLVPSAEREPLRREVEGATRERMLRELTEVIGALTSETPIVLVLEDLHWSDYPTLEAVTALARRCKTARLLVIGTYRPVDAVLAQHPLKRAIQELETHGQCVEIPLPMLNELAVRKYLQTRLDAAATAALDEIASAVYQRTEGNPLFVMNLVNDLVVSGGIELHEGQWRLSGVKRDRMLDVPSNVQQLIKRQIERLDPNMQCMLEAASATGPLFTAAAVAAASGQDLGLVEQQCEALARQQGFIHAVGIEQFSDGTLTSRYAFAHTMYQSVLYQRLSLMRQIHMHQLIGQFTERIYGAQAQEHAAELVRHFELGREYRRAIDYAWFAALNALRRHANREAIAHLKKGLALLDHCPTLTERSALELKLSVMFGQAQMALRGYGDPEVELAYSRAHELCAQQPHSPALFAVLCGLWGFYLARGKLQIAQDLAQEALQLATNLAHPGSMVEAHFELGCTLFYKGEFVAARHHLEEGIALYTAKQPQFRTTRAVQHPGVACFAYVSWTLWFLGHPEHAWQRSREALTLAREVAHPFSVGFALDLMATLHQSCGDVEAARDRACDLLTLAREQEFDLWQATGAVTQGWALVRAGEVDAGVTLITGSMTALRAGGIEISRSYYELLLADVQGRVGKREDGLAALAKAQEVIRMNGERFCEAEWYRIKGELTLKQENQKSRVKAQKSKVNLPTPDTGHRTPDFFAPRPLIPDLQAEAEGYFLKAFEIAQRQQAKALELRAAVSLARLWRRQNKLAEARRLLHDTYAWFADDAFTPELKRAKALLHALEEQGEQGKVPQAPTPQSQKVPQEKMLRLQRGSL